MIIRILAGVAIFTIGYALGKEAGRMEELREEQKRLDPDDSHKVEIVDYSKAEFDEPDDSGSSYGDRQQPDPK